MCLLHVQNHDWLQKMKSPFVRNDSVRMSHDMSLASLYFWLQKMKIPKEINNFGMHMTCLQEVWSDALKTPY